MVIRNGQQTQLKGEVYYPAPEVMLSLKAAFEKAGLTVLDADAPADKKVPGAIRLAFSGNSIFQRPSLSMYPNFTN